MRTIDVSEVTKLVRQLCIDANYYLPADLRQAFVDGQKAEQSPLGQEIFGEMITNCDLARENNVPVCQDTGMAIVFAEVGQDVHLTADLILYLHHPGLSSLPIYGRFFLSCCPTPSGQRGLFPVPFGRGLRR